MLPDAVRECLYRAAQEGISNAVRHGAARHVTVDGDCRDGWVVMQISDDGTGGAEKTGLGLAGMRTRAAALGGGVAIDRGTGWRVTVKLPLHGMAEAPA
jgi:signal transduction histidine kinase